MEAQFLGSPENLPPCPPLLSAYADASNVCVGPQLVLFMSIVSSFMTKSTIASQFCTISLKNKKKKYDFIVVGGGSAGAVVASRLSEISNWSVLLIEAGPEEPLSTLVPSQVASYLGSHLDWKYSTVNETNACLGMGGSCYWPRGKNLGGCSVHNGMMYIRGHPKDYDNWNIPGWSWKDVLPFFIHSENNTEIKRLNSSYHGTNGLLTVQRFPWQPPITKDIIAAAEEIGYSANEDLNGESFTGFGTAQMTSRNGLRVSSATAFLRPAHDRPNLTVLLNATVTQILTENNRAIGVQYFRNGKNGTVYATKEVIVSAGSLGSPHLLLLSGIGPKKHLAEHNIKVVKDLQGVGKNLQNHVSFELAFTINDTESSLKKDVTKEFLENHSGPAASTGLSQLTGIICTNYTTPDHPDLQFFFSGYLASCSEDFSENERRYVGIKPTYLHTHSRGILRLASNNPFDHPIITQHYLTKENDVRGLIEGIKIGLALAKTKALAKYNITLVNEYIPACKKFKFMSDEYWRCAIAQNTLAENHQSGSCKMGRSLHHDHHAVVDHKLRVFGVKGLRVADLSIVPKIISGNTAAAAMMIGERAAQFIKHEHWDCLSGLGTPEWNGPAACTVPSQLQLFVAILNVIANKQVQKQFCNRPSLDAEYDFIVVGGGTAGAVVAARLSEIPSWKVLLIEAGPEEPVAAMIPGLAFRYLGDDIIDWKYKTTNEKNACLSTGGTCDWPRGKNLGGTSVHHGMMYLRGHAKDYDEWGVDGWKWDNVLEYFKRSENNLEKCDKYHAQGGPLPVAHFPDTPSFANDILKAVKAANYPLSKDLNGDQITGFMVTQTNNNKGARASSATAFLRPIRSRQNLHVQLQSIVTRIIFDEVDSTLAKGVEFSDKNGALKQVMAKREVVLSGGVIGSPQILLLSGVGPKKDLEAVNVKVVKDLPGVGNNLQNHVSFSLSYSINEPDTSLYNNETVRQYIKFQNGPLSSTGLSQLTGILASSLTTEDHPDIQFYFSGYSGACGSGSNDLRRVGIYPAFLHPRSRGTLKLKSNDPLAYPEITQNYLSEEEDVDGLVEAILKAREIMEQPYLKKKYNIELKTEPVKECNQKFGSSDYWKCTIKWATDPENHQCCSAKMGTDDMSVVNPKLKVYGLKNVRVADASVMPKVTSGNTAAPIIMIGERTADFIKADHLTVDLTNECESYNKRFGSPYPVYCRAGCDYAK